MAAMMQEPDRLVSAHPLPDDAQSPSLRPRQLAQFAGQGALRANLDVFIHAAKQRAAAMDRLLFHGAGRRAASRLSRAVARMEGGFRAHATFARIQPWPL